MNSEKVTLGLIFLLFFLSTSIRLRGDECFQSPSAKEVTVQINAFVSEEEGILNYSYTVRSFDNSRQDVCEFIIERFTEVKGEAPEGWQGGEGGDLFLKPFFLWGCHLIEDPRAFLKPINAIKPNKFLSGFVLKSKGIPSVVTYYIRGWYPIPQFSEGEAPESCPDDDIFTNAVQGKTIGPKKPPLDFKPVEFLTYIITMKHEAFSLGWVTNKGIEQSLDVKLENARKKLKEGDTKTARNILNAFLNELEAQGCRTYDDCPSGKHLTPEAYALLYYNTKYLIDNLKQTE